MRKKVVLLKKMKRQGENKRGEIEKKHNSKEWTQYMIQVVQMILKRANDL